MEEKLEKEEELIERKQEKIKSWVKDNYLFIIIFLFAIIVRFYFFVITNGQPLWWDEAEYMSAAKSFAGGVDYNLGGNRLPGFPLIMSILFFLGFGDSETVLRFVGLLIPSLILIFLTYIIIKEMYPDKKIALISTLIITVLWEHLFYSNRFHTENFALIFQFLAIFIFFKVYMKKQNFYFIKPRFSLIWVLILSGLAVFMRPGNFLFIPALFLFFIYINKSKTFTKKGIIFLISIAVLLVISFLTFDYSTFISSYIDFQNPLAWNSLSVFKGFYILSGLSSIIYPFFSSLLFYAFIFGILILVLDLSISFDKIKKLDNSSENLELKSDVFNLLLLLATMGYFIVILRSSTFEFRWFFPMLPAFLAFTAKGTITFSQYLGKFLNSKKAVPFLILIIVLPGIYSQVIYSNLLIKNKIPSYQPVKDSGLWIKEHSNENEIVFSASLTQHTYYAERETHSYHQVSNDEEIFLKEIERLRPKYMVVSIFQSDQPEWALTFQQRHPELVIPVQVYATDDQQPVLIVYEFNYSN